MTKRVLVVDDDDGVREIVQVSLEAAAGWEVLAADSGRVGIEIAIAQQPDLILLDVMMPEEDGVAIYQKLKDNAATQSIPTILLTAKAQASERKSFLALGIAGLITKPFRARTLAAEIKKIVGW